MAESYCVFWLPRLYHKDLAVLDPKKTIISEEISDNVGNDRISILSKEQIAALTDIEKANVHHVSVEIDTLDNSNRDIRILSRSGLKDKVKEVTVDLKYISSSRNGLIQFFYKTDNRNPEAKFITLALSGAIYHLIKGFFHVHEYHANNADSTLFAYTDDNEIDLSANDNSALMFYLKQYEKKFRGYRDSINDKLSLIEEKDKESLDERFFNCTTRHRVLAQQCINALGESLYYDALLHSWYNNSCKYNHSCENKQIEKSKCEDVCCQSNECVIHDCFVKEQELCKRLHRSAVNTKNAIDSIKQLQLRNKILYDYLIGEFTLENLEVLQSQQELTNTMIQKSQEQIVAMNNLIISSKKIEKLSACLGGLSVLLALFSVYLVLLFPSKKAPISKQQNRESYTTTVPSDSTNTNLNDSIILF